MAYTKREAIAALKWYYGFTTREAEAYLAKATTKSIENIISTYNNPSGDKNPDTLLRDF